MRMPVYDPAELAHKRTAAVHRGRISSIHSQRWQRRHISEENDDDAAVQNGDINAKSIISVTYHNKNKNNSIMLQHFALGAMPAAGGLRRK